MAQVTHTELLSSYFTSIDSIYVPSNPSLIYCFVFNSAPTAEEISTIFAVGNYIEEIVYTIDTAENITIGTKIASVVYKDSSDNFYFAPAFGRTPFGIFVKDVNGDLVDPRPIDPGTQSISMKIIWYSDAILSEGEQLIEDYNTGVQEEQIYFGQQATQFTIGLNYGSVCCDEDARLKNLQRRLNILSNYDTRDIYNCTPAFTTFDETEESFISYPVDEGFPDLIGRIVFSALTPSTVTAITLNDVDIYGNTAQTFTHGDLLRVRTTSPTEYLVYIVRAISTGSYYTTYTVSYISMLSNLVNSNYVLNSEIKISKVNLYSKPYEYQDAASPSTIGKFTASPGGTTLPTANIVNLRIQKNPLGETGSSWLNMFSLRDKLLVTGVKSDLSDTAWLIYDISYIGNFTNYKRFDPTAKAGYGDFTTALTYSISAITSIMTTTPEECTSDTTNYNNISYTEIKKLLNS